MKSIILIFLALIAKAHAQVPTSVRIAKSHHHQQISPDTTVQMPGVPYERNGDGAYRFSAYVIGNSLATLDPPKITLPATATFPTVMAEIHNEGFLTYSSASKGWRYACGSWPAETSDDLDALFPDGNHNLTHGSGSVSLSLSGRTFVQPLIASISGGSWVSGKFIRSSPSTPVTVTVSSATLTNGDRIAITAHLGTATISTELDVTPTSSPSDFNLTIPAHLIPTDETAWIELRYDAILSRDSSLPEMRREAVRATATWCAVRPALALASQDYFFQGYAFDTIGSENRLTPEFVSGIATLSSSGNIHTLDLEGDTFTLIGTGDYAAKTEENLLSAEGDFEQIITTLRSLGSQDTLVFTEAYVSRSAGNDPPTFYDMSFAGVVLSKSPFPSNSTLSQGLYRTVHGLKHEIRTGLQGIRTANDSSAVVRVTSIDAASVFLDDFTEFADTLTLQGGKYTYRQTINHPTNPSDDHVCIIPLADGNFFIVSSGVKAFEYQPDNPESPGPVLVFGDVNTTLLVPNPHPFVLDYCSWAEREGLEGKEAFPKAIAPGEDLPNLVRYAMNQGGGSALELPLQSTRTSTSLTLSFPVRKNLFDISLTPQVAATLADWSDIQQSSINLTSTADPETDHATVSLPITGVPKLFTRLKAE